jgi:drug/metabolite transporter (DMT)-like permease
MFTKIALGSASPITVIADRYIVAFLGMSLVMLFTKTKIKFTKDIWKLIVMSLFQPVLYFLFETYGIKLTTSAFSSIMIALIPVVCMISGIFLLKEVPRPMQYVFTALSVSGVVMVALAGKADGTVTPLGVILLLGAVLSAATYNITSRKISRDFTPLERTYAQTILGLTIFLTIAIVENRTAPQNIIINFANPEYCWSIFYLGIVSSVLAFVLLNYANTHLPVAKTTVFSNITTVVSVIAGAIFLKETFTWQTALATIMIVVGVWGVQMLKVKKKEE